MTAKHLKTEPHDLDENAWWYEAANGLTMVIRAVDPHGNYIQTVQRRIPWSQIRLSLARLDKPETRR